MKKLAIKLFVFLMTFILMLQFGGLCFVAVADCSLINDDGESNQLFSANSNASNTQLSDNYSIDEFSNEKEYLEPCYSDYEVVESGVQTRSDDADEDGYEDNNSFKLATLLPDSIGEADDYSFSINATLHRNEWLWGLISREVDEDYYRFDLLGKAQVEISLTNIPINCDYDLELYMHSNAKYSGEESIGLISESMYLSNVSESIVIDAEPGTYYIRVLPYDETFNASSYYTLSGNIEYTSDEASISDLRFNKGARAALWISDFDPFNIAPLSTFEEVEVGIRMYDFSGTSIVPVDILMYENPYFGYLSQSQRTIQSVLYLWDDEWRQEIYDFLTAYEYVLTELVRENAELQATYERVDQFVDAGHTVEGIVLSLFELNPEVEIVYDIFNSVLTGVEALIAQYIHNELYNTTQEAMLQHIRTLKNSFERTLNPTINEVIKVTSSYIITSENPPLTTQWNMYCDFTPAYDHNGYSTTADIIPTYTEDTVFRGSTYAIRNANDWSYALDKTMQVLDDVNTGGDEELLLDNYNVSAKHLISGQYHWYHFTAPEDGLYEFYTLNDMDTFGELFNCIVPARSIEGYVAFNDDDGTGSNFSIVHYLSQGQTIYLRVRGYSWSEIGMYTPMVTYYDD